MREASGHIIEGKRNRRAGRELRGVVENVSLQKLARDHDAREVHLAREEDFSEGLVMDEPRLFLGFEFAEAVEVLVGPERAFGRHSAGLGPVNALRPMPVEFVGAVGVPEPKPKPDAMVVGAGAFP